MDTLKPEQIASAFTYDISTCIWKKTFTFNSNFTVPNGSIDNVSAQVMRIPGKQAINWTNNSHLTGAYVPHLGPLTLTWFNFNPSRDKKLHPPWNVEWNYSSIPKHQRCNRWSLGMDKLFHPTLYNKHNYLSLLGLKLKHITKRGPRRRWIKCSTHCFVIRLIAYYE